MPDIDIPNRVANFSSLGNSANSFPATTVFTPTVAGLYRVSFYVAEPAYPNPSANLQISWTDANGARSYSPQYSNVIPQGEAVVYSASSQPIKFGITNISAAGGPVMFDIYVEVEQL